MRIKHKRLKKRRHLSTVGAAEPNFFKWLNVALQDERWRTLIRSELAQAELKDIKF
jgi:hypothetical protein